MNIDLIETLKEKYIEFDYLFEKEFCNRIIQYGIISGNNKVLFIKPGQNGTLIGYNEKYFKLAKYINMKYGFTIVCTNNSYDGINDPLLDGVEVIDSFMQFKNFKEYEIYYYGNSNGAVLGARNGYKYPKIKRMLLVNPPLFISYHKIQNGINKFNGDKMVFIFGELDPSFKYVELLDLLKSDILSYYIIKGEDHNLSGGTVRLEDLVETYLIDF